MYWVSYYDLELKCKNKKSCFIGTDGDRLPNEYCQKYLVLVWNNIWEFLFYINNNFYITLAVFSLFLSSFII